MYLRKEQIQSLLDCEDNLINVSVFVNKLYSLCETLDLTNLDKELNYSEIDWEFERFFDM